MYHAFLCNPLILNRIRTFRGDRVTRGYWDVRARQLGWYCRARRYKDCRWMRTTLLVDLYRCSVVPSSRMWCTDSISPFLCLSIRITSWLFWEQVHFKRTFFTLVQILTLRCDILGYITCIFSRRDGTSSECSARNTKTETAKLSKGIQGWNYQEGDR